MMKKKQQGLIVSFAIVFLLNIKIHAQTTIFTHHPEPSNKHLSNDEWSVYLKGFIQTDIALDFQDIESKDGMVASSIAIPQVNSISSNFSIRQSQIGLGAKQLSENGTPTDLSTYIEIDFFGPNGTTQPRFRKGYIQWKNLLIGQTWSNFSDNIFPNIFDFAGPNGTMSMRTIQLRYTAHLSKKEDLSLSLEDPNGVSVLLPSNSSEWKKKSVIPNFTTAYRYGNDRNHIKIGGILSPISYQTASENAEKSLTKTIIGFGGMVSAKIHSSLLNNFRFQTSYGKGIAKNNIVLHGEKYDAVPDIENNRLEALYIVNFVGIYEHWWTQKWSSVIYYSYSQLGRKEIIPNNLIQNFQNAGVNIIFQPYKKFRIGAESNYGRSENFARESAKAFRIQISTSLSL